MYNKSTIKKKQSKGITLIALVITIIVLLILAGVTINTLLNNNENAMEKAYKAKIETERGEIQDMLSISVTNIYLEHNTSEREEEIKSFNDYFRTKDMFKNYADYNTDIYVIPEGEENYVYTENDEEYGTYVELKMYKSTGTKTVFTFRIFLPDGTVSYVGKEDDYIVETGNNTITYELNNGNFENSEDIKYEYSDKEEVRFVSPVKEKNAFDGWYLDSNFSGERVTSTKGFTGDIKIYAKWLEETPEDYFTYSANGTTITGFSTDGIEAFKDGKIRTLVIPKKHGENTITTIGNSAFTTEKTNIASNNIVIEKLVIQDNITYSIGTSAFNKCSSITEITMPITFYPVGGFQNCSGVEKIKFTKGSNGIGLDYRTDEINSTLPSVPWKASTKQSISIEFEEGITKIGNYMFFGCSNLQKLELPTTLAQIGGGTFSGTGIQGEVNLPAGLTSIGNSAFQNCTGITGTLEIPLEVTELKNYIFEGTKIQKLILHDNITSIGTSAFNNCSSITEITMPITLNPVNAFGGCTGVEKIKFTKGSNGIGLDYQSVDINSTLPSVPWKASTKKPISIEFEEGITKIGNYMFFGCSNLQKLELPTTLTQIGNETFRATGIQGKINLPAELTSIGTSAFQNCTGITGTLEIPLKVTEIKNYTFDETKIQKLILHDNITSIGTSAFNNCSSITEITMPITLNPVNVFGGCDGIENMTFTKGSDGIGKDYIVGDITNPSSSIPWVLSQRKRKISVKFEEGITRIGNYMFYGCSNLQKTEFPTTLKEIGNSTFGYCEGTEFHYAGTEEQWKDVVIGTGHENVFRKVIIP